MTDPLKGERYVNLATYRRSGKAVETPVWFAESGGRYYVFSAGDAGKVKRLRNSDRARVAACNLRGTVHGPWLEARACLLDDAADIERALAALRSKYGWQMWLSDALARLTGRYAKRAYIEVEIPLAHAV